MQAQGINKRDTIEGYKEGKGLLTIRGNMEGVDHHGIHLLETSHSSCTPTVSSNDLGDSLNKVKGQTLEASHQYLCEMTVDRIVTTAGSQPDQTN